ncbi:uncharacterized protein AB675_4267 [Cyphellophora attinorum]|uniref:Uncharacterized protein n=1 Tax=Cyphellophora attinorum TaxID=1664694 RepID=A0A0N1NZH1_9EURO|nr:uncharacterized protein AB675_4267 [Phialophora attinorum]KPI38623.1 hypothetical protein AB675_4267 [Phialophora attinorum]
MPSSKVRRRTLSPAFQLALLFTFDLSYATNLQLTSVQPISGFSRTCFNAYSQVLPDCSFDDLLSSVGGKNGGCSVSCVSDLTGAQSDMFLGSVVQFLCGDIGANPPAAGSQSSSPPSAAPSSIATPTTTMSTAAPVSSDTTSATQTVTETASSTSSASQSVSSSATETQASQTSPTQSASATASQAASGNAPDRGEDGTTTNFNGAGGGSPFDGGPGDFDGAAAAVQPSEGASMSLVLAFATMLLLLR